MEKYELEKIEEKAQIFHERYIDDDEYGLPREIRLNKIKNKLINKFTSEFISNQMTIEDYCIGHYGDKNNFCYIIERSLRGLGSILGATSAKFGLYWNKDENRYIPTNKFGSTIEKAFKKIKEELIKIIFAAEHNDLKAISNSTFSYMIRHKIFYLYNSKHDIPIYSEEHINKVLGYYDIPYEKDNNVEANKRIALYNFKANNDVFKQMTNKEFMGFLYSEDFGLDLKQKKTVDLNRKNETCELIEVNSLEDTHAEHEYKPKKGKTDYNDVAARASYIGEAGEKLVLKYEKDHNPEFARKIKRVSEQDDHLGYDILSYDQFGNKVYIEVKTKKYGSADNVDFYITDNELKKIKEENHVIYYVCGIMKQHKRIYVIRKELLESVEPQPILYKVNAKIV